MLSPAGSKTDNTQQQSVSDNTQTSLNAPLMTHGTTETQTFEITDGITDTKTEHGSRVQRSFLDDILLNEASPRPTTLAEVPAIWETKGPFVKLWIVMRIFLLIGTIILPFLLLTSEERKEAWYSSIMGIAAASLPSGGVPVAGGIVFFPVLTTFSTLETWEVVQFSAFTQVVGVGVLGPLNWLAKDKTVFLPSTIALATTISGVAIIFTWQFMPRLPEVDVEIVFTLFAFFVAVFILKGLVTGDLAKNAEPISLKDWKLSLGIVIAAISGGLLVWIIGIGVEKTVFTALTGIGHGCARKSAITSITIVGLVSAISAYAKKLTHHAMVFWIMGLPGIVIGSSVGPWINSCLGKRNIMIIFFFLLMTEVTKSTYSMIQNRDELFHHHDIQKLVGNISDTETLLDNFF